MLDIGCVGKYLFRYRAAIAAVFLIVLILFADPTSSAIGHLSVVIGIALRLWAAGYIGTDARKSEFHADYIIRNGPYKSLKHPIYIGNFFLVLGVIFLFNPPQWLGILYMLAFIIIYTTIVLSERRFLKNKVVKQMSYRIRNLKGEISTLLVMLIVYAVWFVLLVAV
jgi:protein-S-isoprenylcysteine O-methyltransferase Ste14